MFGNNSLIPKKLLKTKKLQSSNTLQLSSRPTVLGINKTSEDALANEKCETKVDIS